MFQLVCHILEGNGLAVRGRPGMMVKRSVRKLLNSFFFGMCSYCLSWPQTCDVPASTF